MHVAEDGFKLLTLPLPLKYWDYRHVPPCLLYTVLGTRLRALYEVGKCITTRAELQPQPKGQRVRVYNVVGSGITLFFLNEHLGAFVNH